MTTTTIDQKTFTITFERRLSASRDAVFDAWTRPEQLSQWWDPSGARLVECRVDLRPGGAFHFANTGHSPPFAGTYSVVERPSKIVFDALGSIGTITLERVGQVTQMRVTIRCASKAHLDQFIQLGVATNTDRTLDNLVALLDAPVALSPTP